MENIEDRMEMISEELRDALEAQDRDEILRNITALMTFIARGEIISFLEWAAAELDENENF